MNVGDGTGKKKQQIRDEVFSAGFPNLIVENQIPVASIDSPVPSRAAAAAPALLLFNSPCPDN
jgi:hypothetical protein